jgi:macrodomain Ter protein organizer (MatP/YcbG family)
MSERFGRFAKLSLVHDPKAKSLTANMRNGQLITFFNVEEEAVAELLKSRSKSKELKRWIEKGIFPFNIA